MLIHIVSPGESIVKIANGYHCDVSDIKANNLHITDYNHLAPGTKLKIPYITKDKIETLEETEPFVSDYYPTYNGYLDGKNVEKIEENKLEINDSPKEETINPIIIEDEVIEAKVEVQPDHPKPKEQKFYPYQPQILYFGNVIPKYDSKYIRKI